VVLPGGRDSGGRRFFIALERMPELDGRRTQFARVASGLEVVQRMQSGDVVVNAYLLTKTSKKSKDAKKPPSPSR
jgi:cyclophilin family peptidyl-prolyl cis-trans isomerase